MGKKNLRQVILNRMADNWRLSRRPTARKCWIESADIIVPIEMPYDEVLAMEQAGLIEVAEVAPPCEVMRLTASGRSIAQKWPEDEV